MTIQSKFDLTGKKFNQLTVISYQGKDKFGKSLWLYECDCEKKTQKIVRGIFLTSGKTKSCGCLLVENCRKRTSVANPNYSHGHTINKKPTPELSIWYGMIKRCTNPSDKAYKYYGGRGITVCDEWMNSFEKFLSDMGFRPGEKYSIERKDVNGNYEPNNCIWATKTEQVRNRRVNKTNKTGVTGVTWRKDREKYIAKITVNYKQIHLGEFDILEDAINARKQAEEMYWKNK